MNSKVLFIGFLALLLGQVMAYNIEETADDDDWLTDLDSGLLTDTSIDPDVFILPLLKEFYDFADKLHMINEEEARAGVSSSSPY